MNTVIRSVIHGQYEGEGGHKSPSGPDRSNRAPPILDWVEEGQQQFSFRCGAAVTIRALYARVCNPTKLGDPSKGRRGLSVKPDTRRLEVDSNLYERSMRAGSRIRMVVVAELVVPVFITDANRVVMLLTEERTGVVHQLGVKQCLWLGTVTETVLTLRAIEGAETFKGHWSLADSERNAPGRGKHRRAVEFDTFADVAVVIPFLVPEEGDVPESVGNFQRESRAKYRHALLWSKFGVLGIKISAARYQDVLHWAERELLAIRNLVEAYVVPIDDVDLGRAFGRGAAAGCGRIARVGLQHVNVQEVVAKLVTAIDVRERQDVLGDVLSLVGV